MTRDADNGRAGPAAALEVAPEQAGTRLLEFVSLHLVCESKARLRRLIAAGDIRLNDAAVSTIRTVWSGDVISLPPGLRTGPPPAAELPIRALYEDADYACIDKPAGWPVVPARAGRDADFSRALLAWMNRDAPPAGPYVRPHVVHRLDRDTSGVLLVARSAPAGRALGRQFVARTVCKTYLAIVDGAPCRDRCTVDAAIAREPGDHLRMTARAGGGRPALTEVLVRERLGPFSLLELQPHSGRQHQLRVHLAAMGHPLAVDRLYGRRTQLTGRDLSTHQGIRAAPDSAVLLDRCPLHALRIACRHPRTGAPVEHTAPLPEDMRRLLALLRAAHPPG
ncbi:MAG: RluA family pseudouridine synthase [Candidatus Brocadiaceae bacterium]|nr:RluA family pseudouridine synthase [Candidatus Brocadiaceae bacterium]